MTIKELRKIPFGKHKGKTIFELIMAHILEECGPDDNTDYYFNW